MLFGISSLTLLKGMQVLPNGVGGVAMSLDCIHGQVSRDMVQKMGFPRWFPTALGCYKLAQLALNWVADGAYMPLSQIMFAFQLGGAAFAHIVAEKPDGKPLVAKVAPVGIFFSTTVAIQTMSGSPSVGLAATIALHGFIAALGFLSGYVILALGPGTNKAIAMSPVKWAKKRGFA